MADRTHISDNMGFFRNYVRLISLAVAGTMFLCGSAFAQPSFPVAVGTGVTFSVTVSGSAPFTYQWKKGGANISSATAATYSIVSAQLADAGNYSVTVTNSAGSTTPLPSDTVSISVQNLIVTVTTDALNSAVAAGGSVTLTAAVAGSPAPTYQWRKNSADIAGATNATLILTNFQLADAASYTMVATNSGGPVTSAATALTLMSPTLPAFTTNPVAQSVSVGNNVTFTVVASGSPVPTYQWKKNGASLVDGGNISGATSASLTLTNVQLSDGATYSATATNIAGTATSSGAVLTVTAAPVIPTITTNPVSQTVAPGASVTLTVVASGSPVPTFQWKKNGAVITGATSASLVFASVQAADGATYTVVATNLAGFATSTGAVLTVTAAVAPIITSNPSASTVTVGQTATFTAAASGIPAPTFQWKKGSTTIAGATSAILTLTNVQLATSGSTYKVVATNSAGSATSISAILTVSASTSPTITTQPLSQNVLTGANVSLIAAASGTPSPSFQWQKNGANITGATSATLVLTNVQAANAGVYTIAASNSAGTATSIAATLTVGVAPAITLQPGSQTVTAGNAVTFTAAASGTPAPTFRWQISTDGGTIWNNLANDATYGGVTTTTLTVSGATAGLSGAKYRCVATNFAGTATSNAATLSLNTNPFTLQPVSQSVNAGATVTFTVAANGAPAPTTFQWQISTDGGTIWNNLANDATYSGVTTTSLTVSGATAGLNGAKYRCVATNSTGTAASGPATLVIQGAVFNLSSPLWLSPTAGLCNIWLMNGTAFSSGASLGVIPTAWQVVAAADFDGDGQNDILWQNTATGQRNIWLMNGITFSSTVDLGTYDPAWQMVAAADFNGDGSPDILWQNTATGQRSVIWLMNGTTFGSVIDLGTYEPSWQMVTAVDFNGDGFPDILWQNKVTGQRTIWLMNGTAYMAGVDFGNYDIRWQMMTAADFNGDGQNDILWQNTATGQRTIWLMNGITFSSAVDLGLQNPRWRAAAAADFNGNGQPDILWQANPASGDFNGDGHHDILLENTATGQRTIWLMNGTTFSTSVDFGTYDLNWRMVTAVDFDADGQSDILWQNTATGQRRIWLMSGATFGAEIDLGTYDPAWQMVAAADFNADGHPDILWQNTATGQRRLWLMNGTTYSATIDFGIYDVSWQIVTAADFDGDGHPDILWQNTATGRRTIWLMNGTAYSAGIDFGTYDVNWQMVAAADFNDDSQTDILWQNTATGQRTIWLMNGTTFGSGVDLGTYDLNWQMRN